MRGIADFVLGRPDAKWMAAAKNVTTVPVSLERTDVDVTQLALVWIPVP